MTRMPDVLLVSGSGRYDDALHSFPEAPHGLPTSSAPWDCQVKITADVEGGLGQPRANRLLVINIGNP